MAGLDPQAARSAAAHVDLIADAQWARLGQVLDMLRRDPFGDQFAATAGTASRQPDRHDSVDPLGWQPVRVPPMGRARLAPGTFGIRLGVLPGERGGLPLAGPAQRLHLGPQALVSLPESLTLGPQPLVLPAQPLAFGLQALLLVLQQLLLLAQYGVLVLQAGDAPLQHRRASQVPDGAPTHGHHRHKTRRLQPAHPPSRTRYLNTAHQDLPVAWTAPGQARGLGMGHGANASSHLQHHRCARAVVTAYVSWHVPLARLTTSGERSSRPWRVARRCRSGAASAAPHASSGDGGVAA